MTLQKQFFVEISAFLKAQKMKPTYFGREAMGDPNFVIDLKRGRAPNLKTIERARKFIAGYAEASA